MGQLIYAANTSLDGFIEDASGAFDWSEPGEDLHRCYNDLMRGIGTQLLGRRIYETMAVWETDPSFTAGSPILTDFADAWQDSDKVVYSTTLTTPITERTRIAPAFDADEVRALKDASAADLLVGGAELAAHAFRAGLVDEVLITLFPVAVGTGKPGLPTDVRLDLEFLDERRFDNGLVQLRYQLQG